MLNQSGITEDGGSGLNINNNNYCEVKNTYNVRPPPLLPSSHIMLCSHASYKHNVQCAFYVVQGVSAKSTNVIALQIPIIYARYNIYFTKNNNTIHTLQPI